jgi:hypothetical protein
MSEHDSMSQLSDKCSKCGKKDTCNDKRIEACAYIIPSTMRNIMSSAKAEINIRLGNEFVNAEDIRKSITEQIYRGLEICDRY